MYTHVCTLTKIEDQIFNRLQIPLAPGCDAVLLTSVNFFSKAKVLGPLPALDSSVDRLLEVTWGERVNIRNQ